MNPDNRPVTITCEICGDEGRMYRGTYEDERDLGPCPECNGAARVEVPSEPVTLEDVSDPIPSTNDWRAVFAAAIGPDGVIAGVKGGGA